MEILKSPVEDLKCAVYREQAAHEETTKQLEVMFHEFEKEQKMHLDGESNLLTSMQSQKKSLEENETLKKSLKELITIAWPVVDLFERPTAGIDPQPLVD